jgi:hypothetical protein
VTTDTDTLPAGPVIETVTLGGGFGNVYTDAVAGQALDHFLDLLNFLAVAAR